MKWWGGRAVSGIVRWITWQGEVQSMPNGCVNRWTFLCGPGCKIRWMIPACADSSLINI
jgi:hypothetical protein